jgi:hypothetical protein
MGEDPAELRLVPLERRTKHIIFGPSAFFSNFGRLVWNFLSCKRAFLATFCVFSRNDKEVNFGSFWAEMVPFNAL